MTQSDRDREIRELRSRLKHLEGEGSKAPIPKEPPRKGLQDPKVIAFGIIGVVLIGVVWSFAAMPRAVTQSRPSVYAHPTASPEEQALVAARLAEEAIKAPAWRYTQSVDPMTDRQTNIACTESTNVVRLSSPYQNVSADLCVRQSPKFGLDVYVALNGDGQIICRSYSNCTTKVRFGAGEQQTFSAADSADGSSNIIFITNPTRFVAALKGADVTRLDLLFYNAGNQVVEFKTVGLEWPRPTVTP